MARNQDNSGQGCQGCLLIALILLGFEFPLCWFIAFIWIIIAGFSDGKVSAPAPSPSPPPDDLNNILMDLSNGEIKDRVTQEIFRPGEKVYLCHVHRLGYHEDSWQEMGCRCMVCGNNAHTKEYTVPQSMPQSINFPKQEPEILLEEIEFRDIE